MDVSEIFLERIIYKKTLLKDTVGFYFFFYVPYINEHGALVKPSLSKLF